VNKLEALNFAGLEYFNAAAKELPFHLRVEGKAVTILLIVSGASEIFFLNISTSSVLLF